jgi:hypothetical protein
MFQEIACQLRSKRRAVVLQFRDCGERTCSAKNNREVYP